MFTVDYASMIAPLPYPNPDQLVVVWSKVRGQRNQVSPADFLEWKQQSSAFQALDAVSMDAFNVSTQDQPEFLPAWVSTAGLFQQKRSSLRSRARLPSRRRATWQESCCGFKPQAVDASGVRSKYSGKVFAAGQCPVHHRRRLGGRNGRGERRQVVGCSADVQA